MQMRTMLLGVVVGATLIAGCGEEEAESTKFSGTDAQVAAVIDDLREAADEEDAERICTIILAPPLSGGNCERSVGFALEDADTFEVDVKAVKVTGTNAVATVTSGSGDTEQTRRITLVLDGSDWKITKL